MSMKMSFSIDGKQVPIADLLYPVGAIYINTVNVNPGTYLGGVWERFGNGKTLVGVNEGETEFATVEKTGGTKDVTLTAEQIPSHKHSLYLWVHSGVATSGVHYGLPYKYNDGIKVETSGSTQYNANTIGTTGGGKSHSNLQPYITVYFWKRIG